MGEVWSDVHNAGRKPTASSRPVKLGWALHPGITRRIVCLYSYADSWGTLPDQFGIFIAIFLIIGNIKVVFLSRVTQARIVENTK